MKTRTWLVWEEEYADEGSWEVRATSAAAAKRAFRKMTGEEQALLRAAVMTPEIRKARRAAERRDAATPPATTKGAAT